MTQIPEFKLERYFARYEFKAHYILSASDCESFSLNELIEMADSKSLTIWDHLWLGYTESAGHPELRDEISRFYPTLSMENVLVLTPEEGIFIVMQSMLNAGDEVIVITPTYQSLYEISSSIGCKVVKWPLRLENKNWHLDFDFLAQNINRHTKLIIINFPNNPTGFIPGKSDLEEIIELANRHGVYLFSDEMYRMLEYDPSRRLPTVCSEYPKGISLSGMSKSFGLPGLRIGWLATQDSDLLAKFMKYKDYTTICSSAPSEILAIMALRIKEKIFERNLSIIKDNIKATEAFMNRNRTIFNWIKPLGGSVAFPEYVGSQDLDQFCSELIEKYSVLSVPGTLFGYDKAHIRVGLGRKNLPETLAQIQSFILYRAR